MRFTCSDLSCTILQKLEDKEARQPGGGESLAMIGCCREEESQNFAERGEERRVGYCRGGKNRSAIAEG